MKPYDEPRAWQWPQGDTHFPQDWRSYQKKNRDRFWYWTQKLMIYKDEPPYMEPQKANTLIDIGAHAGSWSLDLADRFHRVIAYEPLHWQSLAKNAEFLGQKNIEIRPRVLSDSEQTRDFYSRTDNSGDSGIDLTDDAPRIKMSCRTTTLDQDLGECQDIDAIKIDVQGHEYSVLKGAEHTIREHQPAICVELNEGNAMAALLLDSWGYELVERTGKDWIWIPKEV